MSGASGPGDSHSTGAGTCSERWVVVAAALNRTNNLLESLLSHTIHTRPGGSAPSSTATPQDSEEAEAMVPGKKRGHEFRVRARPRPGKKEQNELLCRVSLIRRHEISILTGPPASDSRTYQYAHGQKKH